jgi:PadR family transcriptional regulator, regulatory protein AphA
MSIKTSRSSKTRFLILGLLSEGPLSGYDIARTTKLRFRFFWSESYGQIYPELRRLAEAGLVGEGEAEGSRGRKTWILTEAGSLALKSWLEEDREVSDIARFETLLKAYFSFVASPGTLGRILGGFEERLSADIAAMEGMEAQLRGIPDPQGNHDYALMILELGLATYRTWKDWAARWSEIRGR